MERCKVSEFREKLKGEIHTEENPFWQSPKPPANVDELIHSEKGAAIAAYARLTNTEIDGQWHGIGDKSNPVADFVLGGKEGNILKHAIWESLSAREMTAKPVFNELKSLHDEFQRTTGQEEPTQLWRQDISSRAKELQTAILSGDGGKYGVNTGNYYGTMQFLKWMENGGPVFNFNAAELEGPLQKGLSKLSNNLMASGMTLNPMGVVFHTADLPLRIASQYPLEALHIAPELINNPKIMAGGTIPEALKAGVYSKNLPENIKDWTRADWAKQFTFIPATQNIAESMAWILHDKGGVPLDEALARVALQQSPWDLPMVFNRHENGPIKGLAYMRYVMLQDTWYTNMVKRAVGFSGPKESARALAALATYSAMKVGLYGAKAAIPAAGLISAVSHLGSNGQQEEDQSPADEPGNLVYKTTGVNLGEAMSPASFMALYYSLHQITRTGQGMIKDGGNLKDALENGEITPDTWLSLAHATSLGLEATRPYGIGSHEVTKWIGSYQETVADGAGYDAETMQKNLVSQHLGKAAGKDYAERPNQ